ncbi:tail protein X [Mesorhizobium sp. M2A.F.Ca.ET.039.01.1.1]|uniref:tail protein X n=1 Tax=Mesorhizobium sp. M2A.F.Ca.ET.039.01.1.1 TaxID=2496746 RepID=UPI000FCCD3F9|nr:tail protein X [Mesorhizobium sp. M2A.F.Ca.ET.039.01.1.1]RWX72609.1 phage tail protein [Mesorhizobium sp. M2A.F.Ca.ET.039.01.1.1]
MKIVSYETVTVESEGFLLDAILWRRFHRPVQGLLEVLLELPANWALADNVILPVGTVVTIPIPQERDINTVPVISLWD